MASDVSKDQFRGLLIPDPRLSSIWAGESSFNQADPQPGIPAAQGSYDLSLTASGTQAASGQMRIRSQAPGHPGKTGPGSFVWKNEGDANWRGNDVPNLITNYQSVIYTDGSGVTQSAINPSVVCMDDQTIVCAFHRQTASAHQVRVRVMSPTSTTFGSGITVYSQSGSPSAALNSSYSPQLVKLPGDRLLLYYLAAQDGKGMIRAYQSADKGSTWTLAASSVLEEPVDVGTTTGAGRTDFQLRYIRAAYGGGQVLLMLAVDSNNTDYANRKLYIQYASDSAGLRFQKVEDGPFSASPGDTVPERMNDLDLVYQGDAFKIATQNAIASGAEYVSILRLGSAFQKVTSATVSQTTTINYSALSGRRICMTVSDEGRIYVYTIGQQKSGSNPLYGCCWVSSDDGSTIEDLGRQSLIPDNGSEIGPTGIWWSGGNVSYPDNMATCFARGRVVMMCNHVANPGNEDNSLHFLTLGGSSTVTMPTVPGYYVDTGLGSWVETWLPFDLPGDTTTWTATVTGTQTLADGQVQLSTGAGQDAYYSANLTSAVYTAGYIVRASLICTSGNLANDACSIRLRLADGADDYDVSVRFSSAGFRVYDNNGSSQVGSDVVLTMSNEHEFIIAMIGGSTGNNDGKIQIWYRPKNSASDRSWVKSTSGSSLTDDQAGAAGTSYVQWGHDNQLASSKWTEFHVCRATQTGGTNIVDQANPGDLWAKPYAPAGYRSYVDAGLFITAHDGPARLADEYNIDTRYGYAIDRIFFSESQTPRVKWRSTDQTQQTIALALDSGLLGTADSEPGNDVIALALLGINWKTGELQGYDAGTTSWTTIATIDAADGLGSLGWVRNGNTVQPGGGSAGSQYLQTAEFEGGTFGLQDGTGTDLRKIVTNTPGKWSGSTTQKLPTVILDGVAGSDRSSGSLGYIMAPNLVIVAKLNGSRFAGYRIKIDAQSTVDGYFTIGQALIGWVSAFGRQYSRGRILETTANSSVTTRTDGTTTSKSFGPAARNAQISWTDGIDVSQIQGSSPDPDYIKGSADGSAEPIASPADVPYQIEGIVRQLDGPDKAVIYLPGIAKSGNTITLNRRQQFIAGRLTSPARLESVLGDEGTDPGEIFRVATVNIQEIV